MNPRSQAVSVPAATEEPAPSTRPGPGRPTRTQADRRNLELLDNALQLFFENGFEGTSIDAITASVGMAKRTVYARYGDKLTLFKAALRRAIDLWIVPIERLKAAETNDFEESLLRIAQILVANIMSPAGIRLFRITNAESGRLPEIGVYTNRQGTERTIAYLADFFRRRLRPNGTEMPDAEDAAVAFLHLIGGPASITAWGTKLDESEVDKMTRYSVDLFLHGILAR